MKRLLASLLVIAAAVSAGRAAPPEFRGIVEGYYGRPWGTEGRLSLLDFMGENGLNVFIYGPKDDPYHHAKWREPYPPREMADFARLLASARKNGVKLYWAIHLGGTYAGTPADEAALFAKLERMYAGGFRSFAVFFDDFGDADATAHAAVCNLIVTSFLMPKGDCSPLLMCPHVYWGLGDRYQNTLGEKLDPRVAIMWTGRGICTDITAADVAKITKAFRRPPFVWWNWPVNDYCRRHVLLGRTYGLEDCTLAGFVSNPMENAEASKIALYGIAAWCRDPAHFDSEKTWEEAFRRLYPDPAVAAAMRVFAEHNSDQGPNGHRYRREESVRAEALSTAARAELKAGALSEKTKAALKALFVEVRDAMDVLLARLPAEKGLGWELKGWFENERHLMTAGLLSLEADDARLPAELKALLSRALRDAAASRARFQAATFAGDKGRIPLPEASARVLKPLVEALAVARLAPLYRSKTGCAFDADEGLEAFSTVASMPSPTAVRDGKYARLSRVLEPKTVAPGETFGLRVPADWQTDYFHARLVEPAAAAGVLELSKDGVNWSRLAVKARGAEWATPLKPADGWRHARYRNASNHPVTLKVDLFEFDVVGGESPLGRLLDALDD